MIMGYEKPVEMPTMNIYNTDLMKAYIAGVKDLYDKALDEMKDFMKAYNDFYSPIARDTQAYHDMTVGGASDLINNLYAQGIDPFKSPEARAAISRYVNSVPTGQLAQMKQSAEAAQEYIKNRGKMQAAGTWNPEYERWLLSGRSIEDWDTSTDGVWNRTAPGMYQDLHSFTDDWFKHLEPKFNEALTRQKHDGYRYFTTDENDLRGVISGKLNDIIRDGGIGQYNYERMLQAAGGDPDAARELLTREIISRNSDYLRIKPETDPYALDRARTDNDIRAHSAKAAIDYDYWKKMNPEYDPKSPFYGVGITKPKGGADGSDDEYAPLGDSIVNAIESILKGYQPSVGKSNGNPKLFTAFAKGQLAKINEVYAKYGFNSAKMLQALEGTDDEGRFASYLKREPVDKNGAVVKYIENVDRQRLFSEREVLYIAGVRAYFKSDDDKRGSFKLWDWNKNTSQQSDRKSDNKNRVLNRRLTSAGDSGENIRKEINADSNIVYTGKIVPVLGIDGVIRTYRKVRVLSNDEYRTMYYDTEYPFIDNAGGAYEDEHGSVGARQKDQRAGREEYGLKQNQESKKL